MKNQVLSVLPANGVCRQSVACPLNQVRAGTAVRIKQLSAAPEVVHRLREMGFCEERKIRLLTHNASLICQVCNVRMGISPEVARAIWVEPLHPQETAA